MCVVIHFGYLLFRSYFFGILSPFSFIPVSLFDHLLACSFISFHMDYDYFLFFFLSCLGLVVIAYALTDTVYDPVEKESHGKDGLTDLLYAYSTVV